MLKNMRGKPTMCCTKCKHTVRTRPWVPLAVALGCAVSLRCPPPSFFFGLAWFRPRVPYALAPRWVVSLLPPPPPPPLGLRPCVVPAPGALGLGAVVGCFLACPPPPFFSLAPSGSDAVCFWPQVPLALAPGCAVSLLCPPPPPSVGSLGLGAVWLGFLFLVPCVLCYVLPYHPSGFLVRAPPPFLCVCACVSVFCPPPPPPLRSLCAVRCRVFACCAVFCGAVRSLLRLAVLCWRARVALFGAVRCRGGLRCAFHVLLGCCACPPPPFVCRCRWCCALSRVLLCCAVFCCASCPVLLCARLACLLPVVWRTAAPRLVVVFVLWHAALHCRVLCCFPGCSDVPCRLRRVALWCLCFAPPPPGCCS